MSDNSHSSKFNDVLARMKAKKANGINDIETNQGSQRVTVSEHLDISEVKRPRNLDYNSTVRFESISSEVPLPIDDSTIDTEDITQSIRQQKENRINEIRQQIDSLLDTDDSTLERIRRNGQSVIQGILRNMIFIEGGTFMMGEHNENSNFITQENYSDRIVSRRVTLPSFYMSERPLSAEAWQVLLEEEPNRSPLGFANVDRGRLPDVLVLCHRLSRLTGCRFRLQSDEEHEYAARGGPKTEGKEYAGSHRMWIPPISFMELDIASVIYTNHELGLSFMNYCLDYQPESSYDRYYSIAEWCTDNSDSGYSFRSSDCPVWVRNFGQNKRLGRWREAEWCIRLVCDDTPEAREAIDNV